jgi:hypothetical protein
MDLAGSNGDPNHGNIIVWQCQVSVNQRWLLTPAYAADSTDIEPFDISANYELPITLEGMEAGGDLDAFQGRTDNGTNINSFHRNGGSNQGWYLDWTSSNVVTFRGVGSSASVSAGAAPAASSNHCIDIYHSDTATAGRELVLWDCNGQASQQWMVLRLVDHEEAQLISEVQLINVAHPELCMDTSRPPGNPDGGHIVVQNCSLFAVSQQFLLTSFDPTGTPEPDHPEL